VDRIFFFLGRQTKRERLQWTTPGGLLWSPLFVALLGRPLFSPAPLSPAGNNRRYFTTPYKPFMAALAACEGLTTCRNSFIMKVLYFYLGTL
jgi:hypothetical protein